MRLNTSLQARIFAVLLLAALATAAVACGKDGPGSDPTAGPTTEPTVQVPTPTPTPAGPGESPTSTPEPTATPEPSEIQAQLDAARLRWASSGVGSYSFGLIWSCFCIDSGTTNNVTVVDGELTSGGDDPARRHQTVDELFDLIQRALDGEDSVVQSVEFERDYGYPIGASIDWILNAIDDEQSFRITDFKTELNPNLDELRADLDAARGRWLDNGPANYTFVFHWGCFCSAEANARVLITVEAGEITSIVNPDTGEPVTALGGLEYMTVPELFDWITEKLNNNPDQAELEFDPADGHPVRVALDPIKLAVDEEIAFYIEDFQVLNTYEDLQAELDAARAKWNELAYDYYTFKFNWECFCGYSFTAPMAINVGLGQIERIVRVEDGQLVDGQLADEFVTINGLFDRIQDAIDDNAASINATFDEATGAPTDVFIDYNLMIADEEMGWNASEVALEK